MTIPIPVFICTAPEGPVLLSINGRLAGEILGDNPLALPLGDGVQYLTFTPLYPGALPMTRRMVLLNGQLQPAINADTMEGLSVISWPNGMHELEVKPPRAPAYAPNRRRVLDSLRFEDAYGSHTVRLLDQGILVVEAESADGAFISLVPACSPERGQLTVEAGQPSTVSVQGPAPGGGEYFTHLIRKDEGWEMLFDGAGDSIQLPQSGILRVLADLQDTVGHGLLVTHELRDKGYQESELERIWYQGTPNWPQTPFATACAFVEAVCLSEKHEALGYLSDGYRVQLDFDALFDRWRVYEGWVEARYLPDADSMRLGLMRSEGPGQKTVDVYRFDIRSEVGEQGPYRIAHIQAAETFGA